MTESPKPISPAQIDPQHRIGLGESNRPPHQQPYSRGSGSSGVSLPPPTGAPQLPPIAPMTQDHRPPVSRGSQSSGRVPLQPAHAPGPSILQQQNPVPNATPQPLSNHAPTPVPRIEELYDHIRQLETRIAAMQEGYEGRIRGLEDELAGLRGHQQAHHHPSQQQQQPPPPAPMQPAVAAQPGATAR